MPKKTKKAMKKTVMRPGEQTWNIGAQCRVIKPADRAALVVLVGRAPNVVSLEVREDAHADFTLFVEGHEFILRDVFGHHDIGGHPEWGTVDSCPSNGNNEHVPVPTGFVFVDVEQVAYTQCSHCGRSGSCPINLENVEW